MEMSEKDVKLLTVFASIAIKNRQNPDDEMKPMFEKFLNDTTPHIKRIIKKELK